MNKAEARRIERSTRRREALDLLPMKGPVKYDANFASEDMDEEESIHFRKKVKQSRVLSPPVGRWWDEENAELVVRTYALAVENKVLREQNEQNKAIIASLEKAVPLRQSIGGSKLIGYVISKVTNVDLDEAITRSGTGSEITP